MPIPARVVFVNPGDSAKMYQSLASPLRGIEPPFWAGLLASFVRRHNHNPIILDADAENWSPQYTAERVEDIKPLLVVVVVQGSNPSASSTPKMTAAIDLVKELKARSPRPVVVTGLHPSALPELTLRETEADYVCQGEGFDNITALLSESVLPYGLWFFKKGRVVHTKPGLLLLTKFFPAVAWDLLDMSKYRCHNWHALDDIDKRSPYGVIYTSLGCPYDCDFCQIKQLYNGKNVVRFRDKEDVIAEIDLLVERYGVRHIKFMDELFTISEKQVARICDPLIERRYGLNIWAYARVDRVTQPMLEKMKAAGINWVAYGIESASDRVLKGVNKRITREQIDRAVKWTREAGINIMANFIFGLPDDDIESMTITYSMAVYYNFEYVNFYTCFISNTPVYNNNTATPIQGIMRGQDVYSDEGNTTVTRVFSRRYEGPILEVKPRYLPAVGMTPEHLIKVANLRRVHTNKSWKAKVLKVGWKLAKDIIPFDNQQPNREYDAVLVPKKLLKEEDTFIDFAPFVKGQIGGGRKGGQLSSRGKRFLQPWPVTLELAELLGWYVAEGSPGYIKGNRVVFSLGRHEKVNIERVRSLVNQCFGYKTRINPTGTAVHIELVSKVLIRALPVLLGRGSENKKIPDFIMGARIDIGKAFLKSYCSGDGTSHPNANNQMSASTHSEKLGFQLLMLFLKVGIVPGCLFNREEFRLSYQADLKCKKYLEDNLYYYIPVKFVREKYYKGEVRNLETENNTYAVPFVVHNCMAYPGSHLYTEIVTYPEFGPYLPQTWDGYSQLGYETLPLPTKHLTPAEVLEFRDKALQQYFRRPEYLAMVRIKFGVKAEQHILGMLEHKIRRKILGG